MSYKTQFQFKAARAIKGIKQEDAARMLGVAASTLSKWENGETEPTASQFILMGDVYGVPLDQLSGQRSFV